MTGYEVLALRAKNSRPVTLVWHSRLCLRRQVCSSITGIQYPGKYDRQDSSEFEVERESMTWPYRRVRCPVLRNIPGADAQQYLHYIFSEEHTFLYNYLRSL